jgi:hypothetical protein
MNKYLLPGLTFLLNCANELIIMGLIVWASLLADKPIQQTALVVAVLVLSIVLGVFLKNKFKLLNRTFILLLVFSFAVLLALSPKLSFFWYVAIVGRTFSGQLLLAQIMALLKASVAELELPSASKRMQIFYTSAGGVAYGLAPLIVTLTNDSLLYIVDILLLAMVALLVFLNSKDLLKLTIENEVAPKVYGFYELLKRVRVLTPFLFLIWACYGVFFVIEVPLLKSKLNASPALISFFLILNIFTNIVSTKILPENFYSKHASKCFAVSGILICLLSFVYLYFSGFIVLFTAALTLGIVNGTLNLSLNSKIHHLKSLQLRESCFLWYRITIETGILGGAVLCYIFSDSLTIYKQLAFCCLIVGGLLSAAFFLCNGSVLESELHD